MMSEYSILRASTDESPNPTLSMLSAVDAPLSLSQVRVYKQWGFNQRTMLIDSLYMGYCETYKWAFPQWWGILVGGHKAQNKNTYYAFTVLLMCFASIFKTQIR